MDLRKISAEKREFIKENFQKAVDELKMISNWNLSELTTQNFDEILPYLLYKEIVGLHSLQKQILFPKYLQYTGFFSGVRKAKIEILNNKYREIVEKEFEIKSSRIIDILDFILFDPNGIAQFAFTEKLPALFNHYEIAEEDIKLLDYDSLPQIIEDDLLDMYEISEEEIWQVINRDISCFFSKEHIEKLKLAEV